MMHFLATTIKFLKKIFFNVWSGYERVLMHFKATRFKSLKKIFDILACISDSYLLLTTAHTQAKKTSIQHCPPSPPQGGDRFDLCVFISYKY
jgi:hypothetical protein